MDVSVWAEQRSYQILLVGPMCPILLSLARSPGPPSSTGLTLTQTEPDCLNQTHVHFLQMLQKIILAKGTHPQALWSSYATVRNAVPFAYHPTSVS